ncbi:hypothetical protein SacxiDRAFT_1297 [Saccharomonospora xinjiangensis XJ-54]|uniref:Uncharacterized protein n=2 Tax=Saccharomonospora TaxID=1851 RepID=I0V095_9PSEU|nr:hypothetical protein SacxiDRAFT_1297 [Saccharomonospora xinjiangensis XJ-54]
MLGVAAVMGILIMLGAWWMGPSLFGAGSAQAERRVVDATVTKPVECSNPDAEEVVRFQLAGQTHEGLLSGCGHDQDESVRIALEDDPAEAEGPVEVALAATAPGINDLRRPVGLGLLLLGCAGGGTYAFLLARGPKTERASFATV